MASAKMWVIKAADGFYYVSDVKWSARQCDAYRFTDRGRAEATVKKSIAARLIRLRPR
jgi:hypothetical protein